jgi:hypothetical protein
MIVFDECFGVGQIERHCQLLKESRSKLSEKEDGKIWQCYDMNMLLQCVDSIEFN